MAKIGQLYLQRRIWKGRQLVPAAWVDSSVVTRFRRGRDYGYGRLWWTPPVGPLRDMTAFWADGYGGQYIVVVPRWRTVAVMTGWNLDRRPVRPEQWAKRVEDVVSTTEP